MVIKKVTVIDDSADIRETLTAELRDANFDAESLDGPFANVSALVGATFATKPDAVVCDHHLSTRNYAHCTGAEAVAKFYEARLPAVLVTSWSKAPVDEIRRYRRKVPVLLNAEEADPELIAKGFELCLEEFSERYQPVRRPWKTLVSVEDVNFDTSVGIVFVRIPGWHSSQVVRFPLDIIPSQFKAEIQPGARFFAKVNTGAEMDVDLYFDEFEFHGR